MVDVFMTLLSLHALHIFPLNHSFILVYQTVGIASINDADAINMFFFIETEIENLIP